MVPLDVTYRVLEKLKPFSELLFLPGQLQVLGSLLANLSIQTVNISVTMIQILKKEINVKPSAFSKLQIMASPMHTQLYGGSGLRVL